MFDFVLVSFSVTYTLHLRRPRGKPFPSNLLCRLLETTVSHYIMLLDPLCKNWVRPKTLLAQYPFSDSGWKQLPRKKYKNSTITYGSSLQILCQIQASAAQCLPQTHHKPQQASLMETCASRLLLHPGWAVSSFPFCEAQIRLVS